MIDEYTVWGQCTCAHAPGLLWRRRYEPPAAGLWGVSSSPNTSSFSSRPLHLDKCQHAGERQAALLCCSACVAIVRQGASAARVYFHGCSRCRAALQFAEARFLRF